MFYGVFSANARFIRKSSKVYEGSIPVTQAFSLLEFSGNASIEITAKSSIGFTITVLGNTVVEQFVDSSDETLLIGPFTSLTSFYTSIGATQGHLDLLLVRDTGEGVEVLIEKKRKEVMFQATGRPTYFHSIGRLEASDATLWQVDSVEDITEQDLVYVNPPGITYNIIRCAEQTRLDGSVWQRLDLRRPTGRAFEEE